jgi:hypothetical protein
MRTRFFTNLGEQKLFENFQGVFQSNPDIERFDPLVGHLRSSGYFALRPHLENVLHIRILVGLNVDAIMVDFAVEKPGNKLQNAAELDVNTLVSDVQTGAEQEAAADCRRRETVTTMFISVGIAACWYIQWREIINLAKINRMNNRNHCQPTTDMVAPRSASTCSMKRTGCARISARN